MMKEIESARILDDMIRMDYIDMVNKINKLIWRDAKKLEYGETMDKNGFVEERWVKIIDVG